ncbi:NADP-dependent oxidoreductase [Chitinophaga arvensicola]|uniref:NADP-dependent oxidoreductase n=1 Tax=Chitinophaga arvensicola TaxID=29529 RepID=UPI0015A65656|nr:NADP-dependent oxidoreductase [Chitinophaga arvensicola]
MNAYILNRSGKRISQQLVCTDIDIPSPQCDEVLIKTMAIGIAPLSARVGREDWQSGSQTLIPGWNIAGVIVKKGTDISTLDLGEAVFGLVDFPGSGKTYAEYVIAKERHLTGKPGHLSFEEAASAPLGSLFAWQSLFYDAKINGKSKVMIRGAAGCIGHFGVQIARYLGAHVIASASAYKSKFLAQLGADGFLNQYAPVPGKLCGAIDVVLDDISTSTGQALRSAAVLKPGGRLIVTRFALNAEAVEQAREMGIIAGPAYLHPNSDDLRLVANLMARGDIRPFISAVFPFDKLPLAQRRAEIGRSSGAIVVRL